MTDTNENENKDALMEALAAKLLAPSAPSINPREWTDEQRNTFVEALIDDIAGQMDGAIEYAIENADIPDADDILCDLKDEIIADLDYSEIAGNIDASDISFDYNDIAGEVVGWIDSEELAQHIDASEIDLSSLPIESEIKRLVADGCSEMNDAAVVLIGRAMNSTEYGESGIRILTKDEYDTLTGDIATANSRIERVLNFIETTFNIPEPESEESERTADDIVKEMVKSGKVTVSTIIGAVTQGNIELSRELRSMKKDELVEYMQGAGWNNAPDISTKAEMITTIEKWIGGN